MFAQDHQLHICTKHLQTRIKIKFKSRFLVFFVLFFFSAAAFADAAFQPFFGRKGRQSHPGCMCSEHGASVHPPVRGGSGLRDGGSRNGTPCTPAPPGPGTDALAHVPFRLFTDRQQCLPAHPEPLRGGGSCSWRGDAGRGFCDALGARGAQICLSCCGFPGQNPAAGLCTGTHGALQLKLPRFLCTWRSQAPSVGYGCEGC